MHKVYLCSFYGTWNILPLEITADDTSEKLSVVTLVRNITPVILLHYAG